MPDHKENAVVIAKTPDPRSYYLETDCNSTVWRNRQPLSPNPKEVKCLAENPFTAPPKASKKDQPPAQAEKKEALHPIQKSSIAVPITTTRSQKKLTLLRD